MRSHIWLFQNQEKGHWWIFGFPTGSVWASGANSARSRGTKIIFTFCLFGSLPSTWQLTSILMWKSNWISAEIIACCVFIFWCRIKSCLWNGKGGKTFHVFVTKILLFCLLSNLSASGALRKLDHASFPILKLDFFALLFPLPKSTFLIFKGNWILHHARNAILVIIFHSFRTMYFCSNFSTYFSTR